MNLVSQVLSGLPNPVCLFLFISLSVLFFSVALIVTMLVIAVCQAEDDGGGGRKKPALIDAGIGTAVKAGAKGNRCSSRCRTGRTDKNSRVG